MPKPASASVRLPSLGVACLLLFELVLPSPAVGGGPPSAPPTPEAPDALGIEELGYDPEWVTPAAPADITVDPAGGAGVAGQVADNGIGLRPEPLAADTPSVRMEVASERTETGRVFANPDGTHTLEVSQERVHFRDAAGDWQPIDLSLINDAVGPYTLRVAANDLTVRFARLDADLAVAELSADGLSIGLRGIGFGAGARDANQVSFDGGQLKGDLGVRPREAGFEFFVTLEDPDQRSTYHFALDTRGLIAELGTDGKSVLLYAPVPHGPLAGDEQRHSSLVGGVSAPMMLEGGRREGNPDPVSVILTRPGDTDPDPGVPLTAVAGLSPDEVLLTYRIDPAWLANPAREFPVVLDPLACIGNVFANCDLNHTSGSFDEFIFSQNPDSNTLGWTVVRTGYDNRPANGGPDDGGVYAAMRGLFYFPDIALGDGAQVTQASVRLTADGEWGAEGQPLQFFRVTKPWATNDVSWNDMLNPQGWDGASGSPPTTIPTGTGPGTQVTFDVTDITRSWYTRRGADWKPNIGLLLKFQNEGVAYGEVAWRKGDSNTPLGYERPLLMINYVVPRPEFDFAPTLGPTYAPSAMVAGQTTKLPITVRNDGSGFTFNYQGSDRYRVGYRWFDVAGNLVTCPDGNGCQADLPADVANNTTSALFALNVKAPLNPGQYTLRLDLVHVVGSASLWASDWATPSDYYSRDKKVLTSDSTRWTGSSGVERDEFGINVATGGGGGGEVRWVTLGDGSRMGVNLGTRNLRLEGDTGLGFSDLVDLDLTYGYDRANDSDCSGILDACGWYTNWDERFTILTGGYTYHAPSGDRYLVAADPHGQLQSGAPVRLERSGVTLWDESNLDWTVGTDPTVSTSQYYSGTHSLSVSAGDVPTEASFVGIDPRHYQLFSVWIKSTGTNQAAIGFRIADYGNGGTAYWFFYTFGATSWSVPGFASTFINSGTAMTGSGYYLSERNIFADARTAIPSLSKNLRIENVDLRGSAGGTGSLYYDAVAFDGGASTAFDDAHPIWTTYAQSGTSTDRMAGNVSLKITGAPLATSPDCAGCNSTDLTQHSFATWWWKKVGGTSIAFVLHFQDARDPAKVGDITYYAGPAAPDGAPYCPGTTIPCVVQVSPTLPTNWTPVTRNLLEDARQLLGFYFDNPLGSNPSAPPSAPSPDDVTMTGFRLSAVDGTFALFDAAAVHTLPRIDGTAVAEDDFAATYPDRSIHFFNHDGLLERIVDRDGNTVSLDWAFNYNPGSYGPSAYTLTAIRAAGDGMALSGGTAQREIAISNTTVGDFRQWTFTEQAGSTSSFAGRRADFYVATTTGTTYGNGDLVKVSPARHNLSTCPSTRPSGCTEYDYTTSASHDLDEIRDPRWDGSTSGSTDFRFEVTYNGSDPLSIADRSHTSAALLYVPSYETSSSATYQRALVQDAAQRAAQMATYVDLLPGGSTAVTYVPKACTGGQCTTSSGSFPAVPISTEIAATNQFDGLSRLSTQTLYRVTGAAPQLVVTRRASNAAAKVDNYADALAGGEVIWTQSPDQYLASLRDSSGSNPDLYRTEYAYDGYHQPITAVEPRSNRTASYPSVVSLSQTALPTAYWRLNETSGTTAADSSGNGYTGTLSATGVTLNQPGALNGDSAPAMLLNGSTGRITSTVALPQTQYTMSAWVREQTDYSADIYGKGVVGRWDNNSGALLYVAAGKLILVHNNQYLQPGIALTPGRWYHVAATWNGSLARVYVDGRPVGAKAITIAPGTGASAFEIGTYANAGSTTYNNALVDEVALYSKALTSVQIEGQYLAGRSMARDATHTLYDGEGHPIERVHHFIVNGGFENGLTEWEGDSSPVAYFGAAGDPNIKSGFASLQITGWAYVRQDAQFVPGQTVRWQFAVKTDGGGSTTGTYDIKYWRLSTNSWVDLVYASHLTSTWTTKAFDLTIPWDSDGRMRISFWNVARTGTAYFDDMVLVTDWTRTEVSATGQVVDRYLLQPGSSTGATLRTNVARTSTAAHPAIFPTTVTVNYVDGVYSDAARDKDLITTRTFDVWGRTLTSADPDGMVQSTGYAANQTDVASVNDGLVTTTFTADAVGNRLSSTTVSEATTTTYDLRNRPLAVTAPTGVAGLDVYNDFGLRTASFANYLDGTPSGASGVDDLKTTFAYDEYGRVITTVVDTGYSGSPDATTAQTYDRLGTVVTTTAYAGPGAAGPRTTTNHFETYTSASIFTRASPSGVQLPIAPVGGPARLCPGSASAYCNSVATWLRDGTWLSAVDMTGHMFAIADAYGKVNLTDVDLAGHPVRAIANYLAGGASTADQNVTTTASFDLAGRRVSDTDPMGRVTLTTYDDVDRPIQVTQQSPPGTDYAFTKTVYTPAGRVERTSAPAAAGTADANLAWTKTEYDAAGRAIRTLEHHDISGNAHYRIDGFETGSDGWASTASGWFTTAVAGSSGLDSEFHAVAPLTGNGRFRVTTSSGSANSGAWWDVSGQTYQAAHTYHLHADVRGPSGSSVEALFGLDGSGAGVVQVGSTTASAVNPAAGTWTLPAGWAVGDLALFWLYGRSGAYAISNPSGITIKHNSNGGTNQGRLFIGYRYLQAGDTTFGFTRSAGSASNDVLWGVDVFRGTVTSGDPFNADTGTTPTTGGGADPNPPAVTPAVGGSTVWAIGGKREDAGGTFNPPANYTLAGSIQSTAGNDASAATIYRHNQPTSSQDPGNIDLGTVSANWMTWTGALSPGSGANYATTGSVSTTGAWQTIDLNWTPSATVSGNIHVALRKPTAGAVDIFLDNVQVYETADPAWNIPTETAYDLTGRITASLLPPGHMTEAPLITTTAYNLASRPVSVTVNATRAYSHQVIADGATNGLVAYYALDERTGTTAADAKSALNAIYAGAVRLAVAGGVDENRTAAGFDGSTGAATRTANVTAVTNNFSLEAWFRRDTAGTNQAIVHNGTATTGWGIGLDASGNLAARYETTGWLSTTVSPSIGAWHHAIVVRNAGTTTVYLDGTAYAPSNATAAPSAPGAGFSIGRQAAATRYFAGAVDEVAVYTSALSAGAVSTHWAAGHPSGVDVRLTTRTAYDPLGRATDEISPRGILTRSGIDRLGRTTATTMNYRDGSPSGATTDDDLIATAAYNAFGELLGTCSGVQVYVGGCDPSSAAEDQAWRYAYDAMGQRVSQVPPVNLSATALSSRSWTYDPGGRLTTECDFAAGGSCATATRHTDFTYDALGRALTRIVYQGSGTGTPKLSWTTTWNADGAQASVAFDGTASSEGTDTLTFTYDGLGRPDQVKRSATVLTDYAWNADNTLATRIDGTLGTATFTYDWADRLATMTGPLWTGSLNWTYRLDGLLDTRTWPSGASGQATMAYDGAKRPTAFAKVGTAAASFSQAYDRGGNVVSEGRSLTGVSGDAGANTQSFTYDGLSRVTGASGLATSLVYTYDRDSNRLTRTAGATTTTYAYDRTGVLLSRYDNPTTTFYAYDAYGNQTSNASAVNQNTTNTYDLADRLLTMVLPGGGNNTTSLTLDAIGRIATRTPPGAPAETYSYLGISETVWQIAATATTNSALDPGGSRVASTSGGTTGFLLPDLHANLAAVTNSAETSILSATRYDAFGLTVASYDSGGAFPTPWKFQGRLDVSANPADPLYEFSARFYQPATSTFSQLDAYAGSVQDPTSLNRYLYAAANPWTLIDPTGHYVMEGPDPGPNDVVVVDGEIYYIHDSSTSTMSTTASQSTPGWPTGTDPLQNSTPPLTAHDPTQPLSERGSATRPAQVQINRTIGLAGEAVILRELRLLYPSSQFEIRIHRSMYDPAGSRITIGGRAPMPDIQVFDRATGQVTAVYEVVTTANRGTVDTKFTKVENFYRPAALKMNPAAPPEVVVRVVSPADLPVGPRPSIGLGGALAGAGNAIWLIPVFVRVARGATMNDLIYESLSPYPELRPYVPCPCPG